MAGNNQLIGTSKAELLDSLEDFNARENDNDLALVPNDRNNPTDELAFKKLMKYLKQKTDEPTFDGIIDSIKKSGKFSSYIPFDEDLPVDANYAVPVDVSKRKKMKIGRTPNMIEDQDAIEGQNTRKQIKSENDGPNLLNLSGDDQTFDPNIYLKKDPYNQDDTDLMLQRNVSIPNFYQSNSNVSNNVDRPQNCPK